MWEDARRTWLTQGVPSRCAVGFFLGCITAIWDSNSKGEFIVVKCSLGVYGERRLRKKKRHMCPIRGNDVSSLLKLTW